MARGGRPGGPGRLPVDPGDGTLLASVGARLVPEEQWGEIGYFCVAEARGRGLTAEAVAAVTSYLLRERGVERLEWRADVANSASRRVAEKCGYSFEGVLRRGLHVRDGRVDCWVGARLADDPDEPPPSVSR